MDIKSEVIVQSSLALIVAMTSVETIKSGLSIFDSEIPHEMFAYRLITLAVVIFLTILIIRYLAKECPGEKTAVSTHDSVDLIPYSGFTPVNAVRRDVSLVG